MTRQKPDDYAETLRIKFATMQVSGKPRFVMSQRNRKKLERIREKVRLLKGQG